MKIYSFPENYEKVSDAFSVVTESGEKIGVYGCDVLVSQRNKLKQKHPNFVIDRIKLEDVLLFKVKGDK